MNDIRQILCPVDFSDASLRALDDAIVLARRYGAAVTALHVFSPPAGLVRALPTYAGSFLRVDARDGLAARLEAVVAQASGGDVPTNVFVREGDIVSEIQACERSLPADLIVMGTHGRTGLDRVVLGSVAERVLRTASCPVLTVPPAAPGVNAAFATILCPVDFSPPSLEAVRVALSLAQHAGGTLTLLHVVEWFPEDELRMYAPDNLETYRQELESAAIEKLAALIPDEARDWCRPVQVVAFGRPGREVLRLAEEWRADLIVLGVRSRGAANLLLFGSTANAVLREARCPVLTVRSGARRRVRADPAADRSRASRRS